MAYRTSRMSIVFKKKIKTAVDAVIPAAQSYVVYLSPTGFDDMEVVRVITPAWKNLGKAERIAKVQNRVMTGLNESERSRIFRFSVLTPDEWKDVRSSLVDEKPRRIGFRRKRSTASR